MNRQPVALAVLDPVNIGAGDIDMAGGGRVGTGHHLEQCGLAGAIRADHADNRRLVDHEIGLQRERRPAHQAPARVDLADMIEDQQRRSRHQ